MKSNFTHVVQLSLTKIEKNSQGKKRSHEMLREFHISRHARDKYKFEDSIFSSAGNVIFANFHASRQFAQKMNEKRNLVNYPEQAVRAGQINALGLIDEILHYVIELYREQVDNEINRKALQWLLAQFGQEEIDETLLRFIQDFPPVAVYRREMSAEEYLKSTTKEVPNRLLVIEEMALLWLANKNPAFSPFLELFNDADLEKFSKYNQIIQEFSLFFENQPPFGPKQHNLIEMLREPAIAVPHSLSGQLQYMLDNWGFILGKYLYRLLGGLDLIKEEDKMRFAFGPGPTRVTDFKGLADEPERFSPDKDWMLSLILIAKSALVWLDQLSGKYGRRITRLDQIPDEELDRLARWGFTGLWLIGIWQRSSASKKIKQYCGNPEAESSAYSLFDYKVADELGGEA
ncbi:MAG TPA: alpha-amylase, partial [Bacteroidetes bacterium]|nr:alpha-amylase [Bacteroidota bacterium]